MVLISRWRRVIGWSCRSFALCLVVMEARRVPVLLVRSDGIWAFCRVREGKEDRGVADEGLDKLGLELYAYCEFCFKDVYSWWMTVNGWFP